MRLTVARGLVVLSALLLVPVTSLAQEAALSGSVSDSTGAALPGVTVVAVHEATGNTFESVTDDRGAYRIPVRVGSYKITVQLPGFATVTRAGVEVLVNQQAVTNFQMAPSTVQETITVSAEAPLVDTSRSRASGNINPRQLQELPVN